MSKIRKAAIAVALLATTFVAVEATRLLPRGEVIELTGAQNMRFSGGVDDGAEREGKHGSEGRDVRLVYARSAKDKSIRTYRNEDVSVYLKFDSGSLNSKVQSILLDQQEKQHPIPVLALYYGWRVAWLSMYPNLINVTEVAPGYVYWPWQAGMIVAFVLAGTFALVYFVLRGYRAVRRGAGDLMQSNPDGGGSRNLLGVVRGRSRTKTTVRSGTTDVSP